MVETGTAEIDVEVNVVSSGAVVAESAKEVWKSWGVQFVDGDGLVVGGVRDECPPFFVFFFRKYHWTKRALNDGVFYQPFFLLTMSKQGTYFIAKPATLGSSK